MPILIIALLVFGIWAWRRRVARRQLEAEQRPLALPPRPPPEDRDRAMVKRPERELRWRTSVRVRLYYSDAEGAPTERVVDITRFDRRNGAVVFSGHCHLRGAQRTFRMDRVSACADPETGEVIADPWSALMAASPDAPTSSAPRAKKPAPLAPLAEVVRLLVFVGKADGRLMPAERRIIVATCNELLPGPTHADDSDLQRAIAGLGVPSPEEFTASVARLAARDRSTLRAVAAAAERMVATERTVHANERAALAELRPYLSPPDATGFA